MPIRMGLALPFISISALIASAPSAFAGESCVERARAFALGAPTFIAVGHSEIDAAFALADSALAWPRDGIDRRAVRVSKDDGRVTELALDRRFVRGTVVSERSVSISVSAPAAGGAPGSGSDAPGTKVTLEVSRFERVDPANAKSEIPIEIVRQTFALSEPSCHPIATEWSTTRIFKVGTGGRYSARKTWGSAHGEKREASRFVNFDSLRASREAQELSRDPRRIAGPMRFFVFIDADAPDALLEIEPLTALASGRRARARVATYVGGRPVFEGTLNWTTEVAAPGAMVEAALETDSFETKSADEFAWTRARLEEAQGLDARLDVTLGASVGSASVIATFNRPLEFANLGQYWSVRALAPDARGRWRYALSPVDVRGLELAKTAMPLPTEDRWGRPELRSTRLVQTDLPEVIAAATGGDRGSRYDVALRALEETNARIEFDADMASSKGIRAMSTAETLERRKGVCQHFANVFVAIARAAGVPSRIVTGARLSEGRAELHAWAEYEASEGGPWLPVEPQAQIPDFPKGRYLPFAVSAILDDPSDEVAVATELSAFFELRGSIAPATAEAPASAQLTR